MSSCRKRQSGYTKKLTRSKQRLNKKKFVSFDIETYGKYNKFYFGSMFDGEQYIRFDKKETFKREIIKKKYKGCWLSATNLQFDFFGLYDDTTCFKAIWRGSHLIALKTWVYKGKLYPKKINKSAYGLTFIDTLNFAQISLKSLGDIINIHKLEKPSYLGLRRPRNEDEWDYLIKYNLQDSLITYKFMEFFQETIHELGGDMRLTIASVSMKLFRNRFLKKTFNLMPVESMLEQFKSYYGGRTEVFKRGEINDLNYYDINSLYPSVMTGRFPDPNSLRVINTPKIQTLYRYEGCSLVEVESNIDLPVLPYRTDTGKVLFPNGKFKGWYCHNELRHAIKKGVIIKHLEKSHIFLKNCYPFKDFVKVMYNTRLKYKEQKSPMEYVVKIILNSLYGKFAQRFDKYKEWIPCSQVKPEQVPDDLPEFSHDFKYVRLEKKQRPATFCIPIWASYVTAYARIKIYKYLEKYDPVYCDTDSIITKHELKDSKELGSMKLECKIKKGIFMRPKMYSICTQEDYYSKIKGVPIKLSNDQFTKLIMAGNFTLEYDKLIKFRESIRRKLKINQKVKIRKKLDMDDNKRKWQKAHFTLEMQTSKPLTINA